MIRRTHRVAVLAALLLSLGMPGRAQTIEALYDQMDSARQQRQFGKLAELYTIFFARKKHVHAWDFFRAAQASAQADQADTAFGYLEKMRENGWIDDTTIEQEKNLASLHGDPRWVAFLTELRTDRAQAPHKLDPARIGLEKNPATAQIEAWMADKRVDAATLYARLSHWNDYPVPRETGLFLRFENTVSPGLRAPYFVYIPHGYDPTKPTALLVFLRGGIGAEAFPSPEQIDYRIENPFLPFLEQNNLIEVFPEGNSSVFWTKEAGMRNIQQQLAAVRQRLNVDDDRIYLAGFSNGGTGTYAFALNAPSTFAGFLSINGALRGNGFLTDLTNRPLTTLASELDDYSDVPLLKKLNTEATKAGTLWTLTELKGQHHYYPPYEDEALPPVVAAMTQLRRNPKRLDLIWETADPACGRCDWIQIDALALDTPRAPWHVAPSDPRYALERNGRIESRSIADESGAVRAHYERNRFLLKTSRVKRVTVWLQPGMVDFSKPIEVIANGKTVFTGKVSLDKQLIGTEFLRTSDRSQLYGAKLSVAVPPVQTNETLRQELLQRAAHDQAMMMDPKVNPLGPGRDARIRQTMRENSKRVMELIKQHGWLGESLVGSDGANALWLIIQHADADPTLQRSALVAMTAAVKTGEASPRSLAYLTDRVRVNAGQKQVYGTQLTYVNGDPIPRPCVDEANLNKRRAEMGMETVEDYLKMTREALVEIRKKLAK